MATEVQVLGTWIKTNLNSLAVEIYQLELTKMPELNAMQTSDFKEKSIRDIEYTLLYLANAISVSSPKIFVNYMDWFIELMKNISIPMIYLKVSIECIYEVFQNRANSEHIQMIDPYIEKALERFENQNPIEEVPQIAAHFLQPHRQQYVTFLLNGERHKADALVKELVSQKVPVEDIYMEIFHESQHEIGKLWQSNKITIAEEHYCTASTQLIMGQLYPLIFATPKNDLVFVGTCVGGELHELGVRMVSDFMELAGWNTYYLGANTPNKSIIEAIIKNRADVIGISVTMTFHIDEARELIRQIRAEKQCSHIKILVGGYPFLIDDSLWQTIGADAYARNAREAIRVATESINKEKPYDHETRYS